jgi:hypothetical protein
LMGSVEWVFCMDFPHPPISEFLSLSFPFPGTIGPRTHKNLVQYFTERKTSKFKYLLSSQNGFPLPSKRKLFDVPS